MARRESRFVRRRSDSLLSCKPLIGRTIYRLKFMRNRANSNQSNSRSHLHCCVQVLQGQGDALQLRAAQPSRAVMSAWMQRVAGVHQKSECGRKYGSMSSKIDISCMTKMKHIPFNGSNLIRKEQSKYASANIWILLQHDALAEKILLLCGLIDIASLRHSIAAAKFAFSIKIFPCQQKVQNYTYWQRIIELRAITN